MELCISHLAGSEGVLMIKLSLDQSTTLEKCVMNAKILLAGDGCSMTGLEICYAEMLSAHSEMYGKFRKVLYDIVTRLLAAEWSRERRLVHTKKT